MKKRAKISLAALVAAIVVLSVGVTGALSSSDSQTDRDLMFKGGSSDKVLAELVQRASARGAVIADSGVTQRDDGETVYQIVLDAPSDVMPLSAQAVWHEGALMKAQGEPISLVQVLSFDAKGKLTFGCGEYLGEVAKISGDEAVVSLADAKAKLNSAIEGAVQQAEDDQPLASTDVTEDGMKDRTATVRLDFPADTKTDIIDVLVAATDDALQALDSGKAAGVIFTSLVVFRGNEKLLEEVRDLQTASRTGWHSPSYVPSWISVPLPSGSS